MKMLVQCVAGVVLSVACMVHASAPCNITATGPIYLRPIAIHHVQAPRFQLWDGVSVTDLNWSGYAVETNLNAPASNVATAVSGSWMVPGVTGTGRTDTYCATWVGLDGDSDDTVEQIGTEQDWTPRGASYYAWFEMYPAGSYEIVNFPVKKGDVISATVTYLGTTTSQVRAKIERGRASGWGRQPDPVTTQNFKLTITNVTRKVTYTVPASYSTTTSAELQSAEWIVEAPADYYGVLPMADFGTVSFTNCSATLNGVTGPISDSKWQNEAITASNDGTDSTPSALTTNGAGFTVTWSE